MGRLAGRMHAEFNIVRHLPFCSWQYFQILVSPRFTCRIFFAAQFYVVPLSFIEFGGFPCNFGSRHNHLSHQHGFGVAPPTNPRMPHHPPQLYLACALRLFESVTINKTTPRKKPNQKFLTGLIVFIVVVVVISAFIVLIAVLCSLHPG